MLSFRFDSFARRLPLALFLLLPFVALGCGGSHYESQFDASLDRLQKSSGFVHIAEQRVVDLPDTNLTIRLPKIMVTEGSAGLEKQAADPRDATKPLSPERLQPLGLELPGHRRTYETFVKVENVAEPSAVYAILAATPKKDIAAEALRKQILSNFERLKDSRTPADTPLEWSEEKIVTPTGDEITWHVLRAKLRDQRFHFYEWDGPDVGTVKALVLPAYYEVYMHEGEQQHEIVAWRATQEAAQDRGLPEIFKASVGTAEFEKPEPAAPTAS